LSVIDGKGSVRLRAIQEISVEGIDSRGKRAACASGPEKSRQMRHEFDCVAPGLGLEALRVAISGREAIGIGGGDAALVVGRVGVGGGSRRACDDRFGREGNDGLPGKGGASSSLY